MTYDHDDEGRGETGAAEGRRAQHGPTSSSSDPHSPGNDKRTGNRQDSDDSSAEDPTSGEVDALDDVIDGEVIGENPSSGTVFQSWSGAMPHPDDLERYETLHPGFANRLLALQERQMGIDERDAATREIRELTIQNAVEAEGAVQTTLAAADRDAIRRGQWLAWSLSAAAIVAAVIGLFLGYPQSLWALGVPVVQAGLGLIRSVTEKPSARAPVTADPTDERKKDLDISPE